MIGGTITVQKLRSFNVALAALHTAQGVAVLLLSKRFALPVTGSYLKFNAATQHLQPAVTTLLHIQLPWLIALFFFLSALAHIFVATIYNRRYNQNLGRGINKVRWIEYSLSASVMMVAIGLLVGIYDLSSLVMLFALVSIMNLMGLVMEVHNQTTKKTSWLSYYIGCWAGVVPWLPRPARAA